MHSPANMEKTVTQYDAIVIGTGPSGASLRTLYRRIEG